MTMSPVKHVKSFLFDFSAPAIFLLGYQYAKGLAPVVSHTVHIYPMISVDEKVFGILPTLTLQSLFFGKGETHFYDYLATFLYLAYFIIPFAFAIYLWFKNKKAFYPYVYGMLLLSYLGFITYVVFPAMPPWLASEHGYIPHVNRILDITLSHLPSGIKINMLDQYFGVNLVAAVPSLHAADPTLMCLFLFYEVKKIFRPLLILYPIAVGVAVVYLGEHYVFDVTLGVVYAFGSFLIVCNWRQIVSWMNILTIFIRSRLSSSSENEQLIAE